MSQIDNHSKHDEYIHLVYDNIHGSLKWFWQIIMINAFVHAIRSVFAFLPEANSWHKIYYGICNNGTFCLLVFTMIFSRIFFGDTRMLDMRYKENVKLYGIQQSIAKYRKPKFFTDFFILILHALFFHTIAIAITQPFVFVNAVLVFMWINTIWLAIVYKRRGGSGEFRKELGMNENQALLIWMMNNGVCCFGLTLLFMYCLSESRWDDRLYVFMSLIVWILNTVIDLIMTRRFYMPDLRVLGRQEGGTT